MARVDDDLGGDTYVAPTRLLDARMRRRQPVGVAVEFEGEAALVPPFELAYEEDERGPCNVRLELVSRLADLASFDGALGGVLRAPPNGDPRNLSGVITTPFGSLEARCEVVAE